MVDMFYYYLGLGVVSFKKLLVIEWPFLPSAGGDQTFHSLLDFFSQLFTLVLEGAVRLKLIENFGKPF